MPTYSSIARPGRLCRSLESARPGTKPANEPARGPSAPRSAGVLPQCSVVAWLAVLMGAVLALAGCSRSQPPAPIALADVPAALREAFKDAKPEFKTLVEEIIPAVEKPDYPKAFNGLQMLAARPGLTKPQRELVARCVMSVGEQMNAAAGSGDAQATEFLQLYQGQK